MARDEDQVVIEITTDEGKIVKGLARVEKRAKKSGKKVGRSLNKNISGGFLKSFSSIKTAVAGIGAAIVSGLAVRRVVNAAAQEQQAIQNLNTSLSLAGTFSQEASQRFQDLANEIQSTTDVSNDAVLQQAALARNYTSTNEEAQKLVRASVELSAAMGESLDFGVRNLGRSLSGLAGELGEALPQLRGMSKEALESGAAIDFVLERFGGSAQAQVQTFSGATAQMANAFDEVSKSVGRFITESPGMVALIKQLSTEFLNFGKNLKNTQEQSGDMFGAALSQAIEFAVGFNKFVVAPIEWTFNLLKTGAFTTLTAIQGIFNSFVQTFGWVAEKLAGLLGKKLPESIRQFAQGSGEAVDFFAKKTTDAANNVFNFEFAARSENVLMRLQNAVDNAEPSISNSFKNMGDSAKNSIETIEKKAADLKGALQNGLVGGLSRSFSALGGALATGENAFDAFGKSVLQTLGQLAQQVGTMFVSIGLGLQAAGSSGLFPTWVGSGLATVAAGLGLIAVGGAIQALAGGGGGGEAPAGAGGGDTGGGTSQPGVGGDVDEDFSPTAEEDLREPKTQVAVNVQGDILDRRESGLAIAEILRDSFDTNGAEVMA